MADNSHADVEGWSAAGETYAEVVKLAEEGIPFALGQLPIWSTTSQLEPAGPLHLLLLVLFAILAESYLIGAKLS